MNRLVNFFHLGKSGVRHAVRIHETVGAEIAIRGDIGRAKRAAVGKKCTEGRIEWQRFGIIQALDFTGGGHRRAQSLVNPVPNIAALQMRQALVDWIPIRPDVAGTVAHGVGIFAHYKGFGSGQCGVVEDVTHAWIHRANDIGSFRTAGIFILHRAGRIVLF